MVLEAIDVRDNHTDTNNRKRDDEMCLLMSRLYSEKVFCLTVIIDVAFTNETHLYPTTVLNTQLFPN